MFMNELNKSIPENPRKTANQREEPSNPAPDFRSCGEEEEMTREKEREIRRGAETVLCETNNAITCRERREYTCELRSLRW